MYKNPIILKSLVVGVIILFLGIGIQPAVAQTHSEMIDFKLNNFNKGEINEKINEIIQKYGHISQVSYLCNILTSPIFFNIILIYLNFLYAIAGLIFLTVYFWLKQRNTQGLLS
jgi:hypothetical protein